MSFFNTFTPANNPFPANSQLNAKANQFANGFPQPDDIFTEGMRSSFRNKLDAFARANSFATKGYTGGQPEWIPMPGGYGHGSGAAPLQRNPNYNKNNSRKPIKMKVIGIRPVKPLPPRRPPPPPPPKRSSGGFRKNSPIIAGNPPPPPSQSPLAGFNHGAVLGYDSTTWNILDNERRVYACLQDCQLTIPGLHEKAVRLGLECPDAVAFMNSFFTFISSTDVQQPVRVAMTGYTDFVITVSDALFNMRIPVLSFSHSCTNHGDPKLVRDLAAPKAPALIEALNEFFITLMSPLTGATYKPYGSGP